MLKTTWLWIRINASVEGTILGQGLIMETIPQDNAAGSFQRRNGLILLQAEFIDYYEN